MVHEVRKISLSMDELSKTLESYQRLVPKFMPEGKIITCEPQGSEGIDITLEIKAGNSSQKTKISIRKEDLLKPFLRFCPESNIILPKAGKKSILVEGDELTLYIELNHLLESK